MKFQEHDVVALLSDLPEHNLTKGQVGTVLIVHDSSPQAYEVEFCDDEGVTVALLTLQEETLRKSD